MAAALHHRDASTWPGKRVGVILVTLIPEPSVVPSDTELVNAVRCGETDRFEELIRRYQPRLFSMARRYARREDEVEDIVQEILMKAFVRLETWRGDAPFEHWLMRLGTRICYDFLRQHQRSRETTATELSRDELDWMEQQAHPDPRMDGQADAARALVARVLDQLSPASRLVITLLELEDKSVKEIAALTGWTVPVVKVRAFRARLEMKRIVERLGKERYL